MAKQSLLFLHEGDKVKSDLHQAEDLDPIHTLDGLKLNYDPFDIEEILLEEMDISEISLDLKKKLEDFGNVHSFGINKCGLQNLNNMPKFNNLTRFTADGNQLKINCLNHLRRYPGLKSLSLINNQLESKDLPILIKYLQTTSIQQLNLFGNPINNYSKELFMNVPNLYVIDNLLATGEQVFYDCESPYCDLGRQDGQIMQDLSLYNGIKPQ